MKISSELIPEMTIEDFADQHGLVMEVRERKVPIGSANRYCAYFSDAEIKDNDGFLVGVYGDGATPEEAINDYSKRISLKTLVIAAYTDQRREYNVPRLKASPVRGGLVGEKTVNERS